MIESYELKDACSGEQQKILGFWNNITQNWFENKSKRKKNSNKNLKNNKTNKQKKRTKRKQRCKQKNKICNNMQHIFNKEYSHLLE